MDFMTQLWTSVFIPGPTPPLLLATNLTFGALQLVLLALLVATYSIHFVILSFLCAGLWGAINWFAAELVRTQIEEAEREKAEGKEGKEAGDKDGEESEVVESDEGTPISRTAGSAGAGDSTAGRREMQGRGAASSGTGMSVPPTGTESRQRVTRAMDASGEISTDSEWEKVEEES